MSKRPDCSECTASEVVPQIKRTRGDVIRNKKEHNEKFQHTPISCKLKKVLSKADPELAQEIHLLLNKVASNVSRVSHEAYIFAEFHLLRLRREGLPWPEINQSFFKSCCVLVSLTKQGVRDSDLMLSMEEYFKLRPEGFKVPFNEYMSNVFSSLAQNMETMTENHVVMNIERRLLRQVRAEENLSKYDAERFIKSAMYDDLNMLTVGQYAFRAEVMYDPSNPELVKKNIGHFLNVLAGIQEYQDNLPPQTKGKKTFNLLPKKNGYVGSFFLITETTLPVILKLLPRDSQERIVRILQSQCVLGDESYKYFESRLSCDAVFPDDFHQHEERSHALWHVLFDVGKYETVTRKFTYKLATNGYGATVFLEKPRLAEEVEYDPLPRQFQGKTLIGVDPGRIFVATTFDGMNTVQISNKEVRHDSKTTHRRIWGDGLRKMEPEYSLHLTKLPSLKTADLDKYKAAVRETLLHSEFLFDFCEKRAFRAWRFKTARFAKKAYAKAAKKVIGGRPSKEVIVGFGDWSQQDGFLKGSEKAGVKRLRRELRAKNIKVVSIDEYRTSKVCSACSHAEKHVENVLFNGRKSHQVVHCSNSICNVVWQRDYNASRNIRQVLVTMLRREQRPEPLRRGLVGDHDLEIEIPEAAVEQHAVVGL